MRTPRNGSAFGTAVRLAGAQDELEAESLGWLEEVA